MPQLVTRGHHVIATTRRADKLDRLRAVGAGAIVLDGLDAGAVGEAVARAEPDVIVHQMTALAGKPDLRHFDRYQRALENGVDIDSPKAYLSAVVTRLSIDELRSARARRESYVGEWLPEPLLTDDAAADAETAAPFRWHSWSCSSG